LEDRRRREASDPVTAIIESTKQEGSGTSDAGMAIGLAKSASGELARALSWLKVLSMSEKSVPLMTPS
jgi:hypothetical protein